MTADTGLDANEEALRARLGALGAAMDAAQDEPGVPSDAARRPRRLLLVAAVVLVLFGCGVVLTRITDDPGEERVITTRPPEPKLPAAPTMERSPWLPTGPVTVLERGRAGDVPWWFVSFETMTDEASGSPPSTPGPQPAYCAVVTDQHGEPLTGGCSYPLVEPGSFSVGTSLGFSQIGTHDFVEGEAAPTVDEVFVEFRSGEIRRATLHPIEGLDMKAWLIELTTSGPEESYLERSQAEIVRIVTVADEVEDTAFPRDIPLGTTTTEPRTTEMERYCAAVESFRSTAIDELSPDAVPYLQAIVDASPDEIRPDQQAMLDAARNRTPAREAPSRVTAFWIDHCTG